MAALEEKAKLGDIMIRDMRRARAMQEERNVKGEGALEERAETTLRLEDAVEGMGNQTTYALVDR
jgi:hypothetical protein